jgi:CheY-like chemotaxis protein
MHTILIVDENAAARARSAAVLSERGYLVAEVATASEGAALLGSFVPTVLLLDGHQATRDAAGLARLLAARRPDTQLVVTTATPLPRGSRIAGTAATLTTPCGQHILLTTLERVVSAAA